eukprot:5801558-Amphidinium_carterae.1
MSMIFKDSSLLLSSLSLGRLFVDFIVVLCLMACKLLGWARWYKSWCLKFLNYIGILIPLGSVPAL